LIIENFESAKVKRKARNKSGFTYVYKPKLMQPRAN
jgi:hypothetical protein